MYNGAGFVHHSVAMVDGTVADEKGMMITLSCRGGQVVPYSCMSTLEFTNAIRPSNASTNLLFLIFLYSTRPPGQIPKPPLSRLLISSVMIEH